MSITHLDGSPVSEAEMEHAETVASFVFMVAGQQVQKTVSEVGRLGHEMCKGSDLAALLVILAMVGAMMTKVAQLGALGGNHPEEYLAAGTALAADIITNRE